MPYFDTTYDKIKDKYPEAIQEVMDKINQSRSKFRGSDPKDLQWNWSLATAFGPNIQQTDDSLAIVDPQQFVEDAMKNELAIHLQMRNYSSARVLKNAPEEIVQNIANRFKPQPPWNRMSVNIFLPAGRPPGVHEARVWGAYTHKNEIQIILYDPKINFHPVYTLKNLSDNIPRFEMGGSIRGTHLQKFNDTSPGDLFTYRNKKFRKLTDQELKPLVDGKVVQLGRPNPGIPEVKWIELPSEVPVYGFDMMLHPKPVAKGTAAEILPDYASKTNKYINPGREW